MDGNPNKKSAIERLYKAVGANYELGTIEEFEEKMSRPKNRQQVYGFAKEAEAGEVVDSIAKELEDWYNPPVVAGSGKEEQSSPNAPTAPKSPVSQVVHPQGIQGLYYGGDIVKGWDKPVEPQAYMNGNAPMQGVAQQSQPQPAQPQPSAKQVVAIPDSVTEQGYAGGTLGDSVVVGKRPTYAEEERKASGGFGNPKAKQAWENEFGSWLVMDKTAYNDQEKKDIEQKAERQYKANGVLQLSEASVKEMPDVMQDGSQWEMPKQGDADTLLKSQEATKYKTFGEWSDAHLAPLFEVEAKTFERMEDSLMEHASRTARGQAILDDTTLSEGKKQEMLGELTMELFRPELERIDNARNNLFNYKFKPILEKAYKRYASLGFVRNFVGLEKSVDEHDFSHVKEHFEQAWKKKREELKQTQNESWDSGTDGAQSAEGGERAHAMLQVMEETGYLPIYLASRNMQKVRERLAQTDEPWAKELASFGGHTAEAFAKGGIAVGILEGHERWKERAYANSLEEKIKKGELSEADQYYLVAKQLGATLSGIKGERWDEYGGNLVGASLAMVTSGGLFRNVNKGLLNFADDLAVGLRNALGKTTLRYLGRKGYRLADNIGNAMREGLYRFNPVTAVSYGADYATDKHRASAEWGEVSIDKYGDYSIDTKQGDGTVKSLAKGSFQQWAETMSEYLAPFGLSENGLKLASKSFERVMGKSFAQTGLGRFMKTVGQNPLGKSVKEYASFQGFAHEWATEVIGDYLTNAVNELDFTSALAPESLLETAKATAFIGGVLNLPGVAGGAVDWYKQNQAHKAVLSRFEREGVLGEAQRLAERFKGRDDNAIKEAIEGVMRDNRLTDEEKRKQAYAIWGGAYLASHDGAKVAMAEANKALLRAQGVQIDDEQNAQSAPNAEVEQVLNEARMQGYRSTPEELQDMRYIEQMHRERVESVLTPEEVQALDADPVAFLGNLSQRDGGIDVETEQAVNAYAQARMAMEGVRARVRDDVAIRVEASDAEVDKRMNKAGEMIRATLKYSDVQGEDQEAYVLDGHVAMLNDGSGVDVEASDKSIVIVNPMTGEKQMVSPEALLSVDAPVNGAEAKEELARAIRAEEEAKFEKLMSGALDFAVGDTYAIISPDGEQGQLQIMADNGDGTVSVSSDGGQNVVQMRKEDVQAYVDNANRKRAEERWRVQAGVSEGLSAEMRGDQSTAIEGTIETYNSDFEGDQSTPIESAPNAQETPNEAKAHGYILNEMLTLRGDDGKPVRGSIVAEPNEDGLYEVYTEERIGGMRVNTYTEEQINEMLISRDGIYGAGEQRVGGEQSALNAPSDQAMAQEASADIEGDQSAIDSLLERMEDSAEVYEEKELTPQAWAEAFDEDNSIDTPLGRVKMGENQMMKFLSKNRAKEFGMVAPTLRDPDVIIEEKSEAKDGNTERGSSYLFIKTFNRNGEKVKFYASITVQKDGLEVSVSSHYMGRNAVSKKIQQGKVLYTREALLPNSSEWHLAEHHDNGVPDLLPTQESNTSYENGNNTDSNSTGTAMTAVGNENGTATLEDAVSTTDKVNENFVSDQEVGIESGLSALERIPKNELGEPVYEQADVDTAWDALLEQTEGDVEMAQAVADEMVADKRKELQRLEKAKVKSGSSVAEKIQAQRERKMAIEQAQREVAHWEQIAMRQQEREAEEAVARAEEARIEAERLAKEEAELVAQNGLQGVPDMADDTPVDARQRGFRRMAGHRYDRQGAVAHLAGKPVSVKFADGVMADGRVAVVEASQLQPSHIDGRRNPLHFIDEAQPKERNDEASVASARKIASNIRPEEITSSVTAYTGAPTVNSRGEVIQGNNRGAALRQMWANFPEQGAKYKQYLMDNAEAFGLTAEEVEAMEAPVLVNMADVSDVEAIELGQYVATDTESGGVERIKGRQTALKLGDKMGRFAELLLNSNDGEASINEAIDKNGHRVLRWLNDGGFITPTQYQSAFDRKGNLTAEVKNDLKTVLGHNIFSGGHSQLEEVFGTLPAKAQRALLATAYRDFNSPDSERMIGEIQASIMAYNELSTYKDFAQARTIEEANSASWGWSSQAYMDDVTGETYLPSDKYSNFALKLAVMYKGERQATIQSVFNTMYDIIQGAQQDTLFETADKTPRTLAEAIKETLNIDYDGQNGSHVLGSRVEASQGRSEGSTSVDSIGEQDAQGEGHAERGGSVDGDSSAVGVESGVSGSEVSDGSGGEQSVVTDESAGMSDAAALAEAERETDTNPSEAQKISGNYKKGHVRLAGFDISIEQPKGSVRRGVDANGKAWETTMNNTYGYIRGTKSVDGDALDVFLGDISSWDYSSVFVVDQYNEDGTFDEHKVMFGFNSKDEAYSSYLANYEAGWDSTHRIDISSVSLDEFKRWVDSSKRKTKAFSLYRGMDGRQEVTDSPTLSDEAPLSLADLFDADATQVPQQAEEDLLVQAERANTGKRTGKNTRKRTENKEQGLEVSDASEAVSETEVKNPSGNKLVTDERYEVLKNRMRILLGGHMNMGVNPEVLAVGTEMAVYHIEKGAKRFADYAKAMIADLGEGIRPYLKSFYNGARELPEVEAMGLSGEMTPYDEVRVFDVANFDSSEINAMATAEQVVAEQVVEKQAQEGKQKLLQERKKKRERRNKQSPVEASKAEQLNAGKRTGKNAVKKPQGLESSGDSAMQGDERVDKAVSLGLAYAGLGAEYGVQAGMSAEALMQVYTRQLAKVLMKTQAEQWVAVKKSLRGMPLWEEVRNERGDEDAVATEVLARLSGTAIVDRLRSEAERLEGEGYEAKPEIVLRRIAYDLRGKSLSPTDIVLKLFARGARVKDYLRPYELMDDIIKHIDRSYPWDGRDEQALNFKACVLEVARDYLATGDFAGAVERVREETRERIDGSKQMYDLPPDELVKRIPMPKDGYEAYHERLLQDIKRDEGIVQALERLRLEDLHLPVEVQERLANGELHDGYNWRQRGEYSGETDIRYREGEGQSEADEIVAKAKADGTYMLAPNGKLTNLTERQWVQVRSKAFKAWFGDWEHDAEHASKVVDENGEPKVVYHNTEATFTTFDVSKGRSTMDVQALYFSPNNEEWADIGSREMAVFLNVRHPRIGKPIVDRSQNDAGIKMRQAMEAEGYDGVIAIEHEDGYESGEYLAFSPEQVKSATDNVGAFDVNSADIRYRDSQDSVLGRSLSKVEADAVLEQMRDGAVEAPHVVLTREAWDEAFGKDGVVDTPIGEVKMGEHQYDKLVERRREGKFGLIKPTLTSPDFIVEDYRPDEVKGGSRDTSYVFVKTFVKGDGSKYYYFASVTVNKDGREVVISNGERRLKRVSTLLQTGTIKWIDKSISLPPIERVEGSVPHGVSYRFTQTNNQPALHGITPPNASSVSKVSEKKADGQEESVKKEWSGQSTQNDEGALLSAVNDAFNEALAGLTAENANNVVLSLGMPNALLQSAGVEAKEMKLYGNKLLKKAKKHGFELSSVRDLPMAVSDPLFVFKGAYDGSTAILTEMRIGEHQVLVSIEANRSGEIGFNLVTSVFGKSRRGVIDWINNGKLLYANKEKVLDYLSTSAPIADAKDSQELISATKLVENFENPSVGVEKSADSDVVFSSTSEKVGAVKALAERLHLGNVHVVTSLAGLQGKRKRAKGYYDVNTGEVTIVAPNHTDVADVEKTLLHEAVAHHGLRELFGKDFDAFLDSVYAEGTEEVRREVVELAKRHNWDFRTATEEYLAGMAEDMAFEQGVERGLWDKVKALFVDLLRKAGFKVDKFNDNELRYVLWQSYQNLTGDGKGVLGEASRIAKAEALGVGHTAQAREVDTLYREGEPRKREEVMARAAYEKRVASGWYQAQEAVVDSMEGLKVAMQEVLKAEGKGKVDMAEVAGFENAYIGQNRLSSTNEAEREVFKEKYVRPLNEVLAKLSGNDVEYQALVDYMMAKHGLERNLVMHKKAEEEAGKEVEPRDYAGLTALTGLEEVAEATAEATAMVEAYEQEHDVAELWEAINALNKATLTKSYESGILSKEAYEKISAMYEYYIPLRGFDEETSAEAYAYLQERKGAFNAPIKTAKGRKSKADDPIAQMVSMADSAILEGNRNQLIKQRFLNFALNHPSDLYSVSDVWVAYDDVAGEWRSVFADNITEQDSPEEVEEKIATFEERMQGLAELYPEKYVRGDDALNIPYRVVNNGDLRQHQVLVKRGGREYVITVNGNPRLAHALNGLTNPDNSGDAIYKGFLRGIEKGNRWLSKVYTQLNPDFVLRNVFRDAHWANTVAVAKEGREYGLRYNKNWAKYNSAVMLGYLLRDVHLGNVRNADEQAFYEFYKNGGETGYAILSDIETYKRELQAGLERERHRGGLDAKRLAKRFTKAGLDYITLINRCGELTSRFAAFKTSRDEGRSVDRAIYDAKEITVNFSRKGSGGRFLGAHGQTVLGNLASVFSAIGRTGYIFFNAGVQGLRNIVKNTKENPRAMAGFFAVNFGLGMLQALGASLLFGDDDEDKNSYFNIPEHKRRSNFMIGLGDVSLAIPVAREFSPFFALGELAGSWMSGKYDGTLADAMSEIAASFSSWLPLDFMQLSNEAGLSKFAPSAVKPISEAIENVDWLGRPIYKDTDYNANLPEYTKAYSRTNGILVGLSKWANEFTGGDAYTKGRIDKINNNPAVQEHLGKSYLGGIWSFFGDLANLGEAMFGEREFNVRDVPMFGGVLHQGDETAPYAHIKNKYYEYSKQAKEIGTRLRGYDKDAEAGDDEADKKYNDLMETKEFAVFEVVSEYQGEIAKLRREKREAVDEEEIKEIDRELNELMKEAVMAIEEEAKKIEESKKLEQAK